MAGEASTVPIQGLCSFCARSGKIGENNKKESLKHQGNDFFGVLGWYFLFLYQLEHDVLVLGVGATTNVMISALSLLFGVAAVSMTF